MKRVIGLMLTVIVATGLAAALAIPASATAPRAGALHITKECSQYTGEPGSFCTITSSNLESIPPGSKVVYTDAPGPTTLDTDIVIYTRGGNSAFGHVVLDLATGTGTVTLSGGTGQFKKFEASAAVSYLGGPNYAWDGWYAYD
jgi:hypothetical protein